MEITKRNLPIPPNMGEKKSFNKIQLIVNADSGTLTIQDLDNKLNYLIVPINETIYEKVTETKYQPKIKKHYSKKHKKEMEKYLKTTFQVDYVHAKKLDPLIVEGLKRWDKMHNTYFLINYLNATSPMGNNRVKGETLIARHNRKQEENDEKWYVSGIEMEYNLAGGKLMDKLNILKNGLKSRYLWGGEESIVVKNEYDYPINKENSNNILNKIKHSFTARKKDNDINAYNDNNNSDKNDKKILRRITATAVLSGLVASLGLSALVNKFTDNNTNKQAVETNINKNDNHNDTIKSNKWKINITDNENTQQLGNMLEVADKKDDQYMAEIVVKDNEETEKVTEHSNKVQKPQSDVTTKKANTQKSKYKNNKKAVLSKIKVGSEFKNMNKGRYYEAPDGTGRSGSFENQGHSIKKISKIGIKTKNGNYIVFDENTDMNLYEIKKQYPQADYSYHITDAEGNALGWVNSSSFDSVKNINKMGYINTKNTKSHDDIER